jgi:hypothetical protein
MGRLCCSQFLRGAHSFFLLSAVCYRAPLLCGSFKSIAFLGFICALAFVFVRYPNIWRMVACCLRALPIVRFPLVIDYAGTIHSEINIAPPNKPDPTSWFQRPPPNCFS